MDGMDEKEVLIQVVSRYKFIYDESSEKFRSKYARKQAWFEIAREVQNVTNIATTYDRAKSTWKKLREDYIAERRKILTYVASGSAAKENCSHWEYYDALQFLQPHVDHLITRSNIKRLQPQAETCDISDSESSADELPEEECIENPTGDLENLDEPSTFAPSIDCRTMDYLAEMKRAWERIPHKNQRKCFYAIEEIIENKLKC